MSLLLPDPAADLGLDLRGELPLRRGRPRQVDALDPLDGQQGLRLADGDGDARRDRVGRVEHLAHPRWIERESGQAGSTAADGHR